MYLMPTITRCRGEIPNIRPAGPNYGMVGALMRAEPWRYTERAADDFIAKLQADREASELDRLARTGSRWLPGFEPRSLRSRKEAA